MFSNEVSIRALQWKHIISIGNVTPTNLISKVSTIMSSAAAPRQQLSSASGGPSNVQRAGRSPCFVGSHDASLIPLNTQPPCRTVPLGVWRPRSQWYAVRRGRRAALPRAQQPVAPRKWINKKIIATNL
jgi:hypothetical protein